MSLKVAIRPFKWGIDQAFMLTQPTTTLIFSNYPGGGKANASSVSYMTLTWSLSDPDIAHINKDENSWKGQPTWREKKKTKQS